MNVLLVVADEALARQLTDFFSRRGRGVTACRDSESARQALARETFFYVLIDLEADAEAADLCRTIRELPNGESVYALVLPAAETVEAMRAALAAGADDYLPKPVDQAALQLRLALGERRLAARQQQLRQQAEESLRYRERYFRSLLENSSDLITIVDSEGHILYQTPSSEHLLGWNAEEMMGWNLIEHVHPDDRVEVAATLAQSVGDAALTPSLQCRIRHRSGDYRPFESLFKNLLADAVVAGVVVTSRDISEHRRLETELKRERVFFQQLFSNSPTGIVILDPEDRVVDANDSFLELFRCQLADLRRRPINDCIVPAELADEAARLSRAVLAHESVNAHETTRRRQDGSAVEVALTSYPIEISGRLIGAFGIYADITQRKQFERELYHHAYHDALTGLPNRSLLSEQLERSLRRVERRDGYALALLYIDLDRFKVINDSLGHEAGDEFLKEIARRLEACVRPGDATARLGGDEFTVILEDLHHRRDATRVADRILAALSRPFRVADQEVASSGSIGIAYGSPSYASADELLRDADLAMYRAKSAGKARYAIFDAEMHERAVRRLQLESELRRAIDDEELALYYQPMVSLRTRRVVGFEALVRWQRPGGGLVAAHELIPICDETGLIVPLGGWVAREVARQVVAWQQLYPERDCLVTMNLSAKEAVHSRFLETIDSAVAASGAPASSIGFEMTESLMVSDEKISQVMWELRKRGFRLYVDDFGTGQASLSALYRFPIDALKIHRSFVQQMAPGSESVEIVRAIVALGESLGLLVVAEGVESREQLARVRQLELIYAQGFLFGKPLPCDKAEKLLALDTLWKEEQEAPERAVTTPEGGG
jgi:Amt family ammonium transporter